MRGGTRSSGRARADREARRVLDAVRAARAAVPGYGRGRPISRSRIRRLARFARVTVDRSLLEMTVPAVLLPPLDGRHRLILSPTAGPDVSSYIVLHEVGHVLSGDAEELTFLRCAGPLPEAEYVADLFALLGVIDGAHCRHGPGWVEARIRARVPLPDAEWQRDRVPRLARKLCRLRALMR